MQSNTTKTLDIIHLLAKNCENYIILIYTKIFYESLKKKINEPTNSCFFDNNKLLFT